MSGNFTTSFAAVSAQVQKLREQKDQQKDQQQQQQQQPTTRTTPAPSSEPQQKKQRLNAFHNPNANTSTSASSSRTANSTQPPPTIQVNKSQTGNPLLQHLTNINWTYTHSSSPYDYLTNGRRIVFLSLKYHKLHPEYIQRKLDTVTQGTEGRDSVMIVVVDVENSDVIMKELNRLCVYGGVTMLCAFGFAEAGKWIGALASAGRGR